MPTLTSLIEAAYAKGASDLHLEPGLPPAFRVDGTLRIQQGPLRASELKAMAREVAGSEGWSSFLQSRSLDLSRSLAGVRCRINILQSRRGVGLAVRLLTAFQATVQSLNLHPSLRELAGLKHGLVLVSGPTGSGKSSTVAALVQEINLARPAHVLTLEAPVEHWIRPQRAFIRQREVGRDTPSFEQGLMDALREDPDVIVVGEMRRPETMRLTLDAAETGHLVFSTVHSSSVAEAIHRIGSAFPAETRSSVQAQLADALAAVVCQTLVLNDELGIRIPECEILRTNSAARASIRTGTLHQLATVLETGASDGSWTLERYRRWLAGRDRFHVPSRRAPGERAAEPEPQPDMPPLTRTRAPRAARQASAALADHGSGSGASDGVFVLDDSSDDPSSILSELLNKPT